MAGYRVSYKVLRQQGDDMKAVAKMVDGYAQRITQINSKLGNDQMLAEIRGNLNKLREQLGESRAVLNTSGELLIKSVESYGGVEIRQVKKVDGMKAHNRDFYKNPVAVASVGGAAGGAGAAGAVTATASGGASATATSTTVNYTDNSTNINIGTSEPVLTDSGGGYGFGVGSSTQPTQPQPTQPQTAAPADVQPVAAGPAPPVSGRAAAPGNITDALKVKPGVAAGLAGAAGGALGGAAVAAGTILGGKQIKKKRDEADPEKKSASQEADKYDPAARLEETLGAARGDDTSDNENG